MINHSLVVHLINKLDKLISRQLSLIIQNKCFKELESAWLGIQRLISNRYNQRRVKVKLLNLSWFEIATDLNISFDIKQSILFNIIYTREFGTPGGKPFGVLLIDHKITFENDNNHSFEDLFTLQLIAELGEKSLCPVILGLDHNFFGDSPIRTLHDKKRVNRMLESEEFHTWKLLRSRACARFLHIVLPEYCIRRAYKSYAAGFIFNEQFKTEHALWGNSGFLLVENIIKEFERISWFGFLRAYDHTGVNGAIVCTKDKSPTVPRITLFSESDSFWAYLGFVPLTKIYLTNQLGFFSNQSVWEAKNEQQRIIGMLQTNLMVCRFGHYIKVKTRDMVGSFDSAIDCRARLEKWLSQYVSNISYGEDSVMAKYPLKKVSIKLKTDPKDPTHYVCSITIQPQYQYELIDVDVALSTPIPTNNIR
ncbi:type VI secretion protein [Parashewanella spongiae]|uniref:Type VI secretion protein n=2 Tax=Parashewanella spongiae TaxID=342950 RepID=A0A3A6U547_9GAMM|nr:type VI secretion protein [Parashewanella spongiae]